MKRYVISRNQLIRMRSKSELEFYGKCARSLSSHDGAPVDLGCWRGSTCTSLAAGARQKKSKISALSLYLIDMFGKTG